MILQNLGVSIFVLGYVIFNLLISEVLGRKHCTKFSKLIISQRILMVGLAIALFFGMGTDGVIIGIGLSFIPFFIIVYRNFKESKFSWLQLKEKKIYCK